MLPVSRFAKYGPVTALGILAAAIALVAVGSLGSGIATGPRLLMIGVGVLLLFFGVSMNAARVVRPLAAVLGAPARAVGGAPGILARDNATRNPARTASTASALMIGLALVTFVAIFGQGVFKSFEDAVDQLFVADYAVTATNTFSPIDVAAGKSLVGKPGVSDVTPIRAGSAHFLGSDHDLTAVEPNVATGIRIDWKEGGNSVPGRLGTDGFFTDSDYAKSQHLHIGSPVSLEFPSGKRVNVRLIGIYDQPNGGSPFGDATISTRLFDRYIPRPRDEMVLVNTPDGVSAANTQTLEDDVRGSPTRRCRPATSSRRTSSSRSRRSSTCSTHCSRFRDREPRQDHQHAGSDRVRADARARNAARGRHDQAAGADDDPLRASSRR